MTYIPYTVTPFGISFIVKGHSRVIAKDHSNYDAIKTAVFDGDIDQVVNLTDIIAFIAKLTKGDVQISNDAVRYKDGSREVPVYLATRILDNIRNKEPIEPICRMTEKLMENPNMDILEDLYRWIEKGNMPIAEDGDIIAFKKVQGDYYSVHSGPDGKLFQGIGELVKMPREDCDERRDVTCSRGLHFCSYDYLEKFGAAGSSKVIIVKINPKNIVAIPTDYNHTKGRCCEFLVIDEVPETEARQFFNGNVYQVPVAPTESEDFDLDENENSDDENEKDEDLELDDVEVSPKPFIPSVTVASTTGDFLTSDGRSFTKKQISDAVSAFGPSKAAEALNIPRSTLGTWRKKL